MPMFTTTCGNTLLLHRPDNLRLLRNSDARGNDKSGLLHDLTGFEDHGNNES